MSGFWSKRKAAVAVEETAEALAAEQVLVEQEASEKTDAELLAELELPDPDTLGEDGDFAAFMQDAIPARLRTRALRRLWRVNPALANLDGLLDYGEDFTDRATVVENLQTAYQVGKGMLAHVEELARQAEAAENPPMAEVPDEDTPEAEDDAPEDPPILVDTAAPEVPTDLAFSEPVPELEAHAPAPTRRMIFTFVSEDA